MKFPIKCVGVEAIDWMNCIWACEGMPASAKLVAAYLRSHMTGHKDMCYPSVARIVHATTLGRATVHRMLDLLESEGWLKRQSGVNRGGVNVYWVAFPSTVRQALQEVPLLPDGNQGVSHGETGVSHGETGVSHGETQIKQLSKQRSNQRLKLESGDAKDFDQFWLAYPRKVKKPEALKAWRSTAKDRPPLTELLDHLSNRAWPSDPKFIPHPSTFLRGHQWADDLIVIPRSAAGAWR